VTEHKGHRAGWSLVRDPKLLIPFSITVIALMGTSSLTPALPTIARVYGISSEEIGWLIAVFTLPGVFLTPILGLLGDRYGRKTVVIPSLVIFALAGSACAFAPDYETLLVLRTVQGIGGAALSALVAAFISDFFSGEERAHALGYNAGVVSASAAIYPIIGGALTLLSWHYTFLLAVLALPVAALVGWGLPPAAATQREAFGDYLRRLGGAVANRSVVLVLLASFVTFIVIYGVLITYLPFLLERDFHTTPLDYGIVMAANAVAGAVTSLRVGSIMRRYPGRKVLTVSFGVTVIAVVVIPFAGSLPVVVLACVVLGSMQLQVLAISQILLTELVPVAQRGAIMAVNSMAFRLGQTIGPTFLGLVLALWGLDMVFVVAGALSLAVTPLCALIVTRR
jgi:predicted MFS family arabinose efflux permease